MAADPITGIPETDKAFLLGYMRHADPALWAKALASLRETSESLAAAAAVRAAGSAGTSA